MNLIINVGQAIGEAGTRGEIVINSEESGGNVRFSIRDDGPGISPENMKRLFTLFFTAKETGKDIKYLLRNNHRE